MKQSSRYAISPKKGSDGKTLKEFRVWNGIHSRAGNPEVNLGIYTGVKVSENWCCYDNFYLDMQTKPFFHSVDLNGRPFVMDKDFFSPVGNPVYSNETTVCVPNEINSLLCKSTVKRKYDLPMGIVYSNDGRRYRLGVTFPTANKKTKEFKTLEAAVNYYLQHKKLRIISVVDSYRGLVEDKVCDYLLSIDLNTWYEDQWERKYNNTGM